MFYNNTLKISILAISSIILASCATTTSTKQSTSTAQNTPVASTSTNNSNGVQHISLKILGMRMNVTTRDFAVNGNTVEGMANKASKEITAPVNLVFKGNNDANLANGFKKYSGATTAQSVLGVAKMPYTSVYKTLDGGALNVAHVNGTAKVKLVSVPTNAVSAFGTPASTNNIPTTGVVNYKGDATYLLKGKGNAIEFGTSEFSVDFAHKTVIGKLTFNNGKTITINTRIKDNTFTSVVGGYEADGNFYGGVANLIGGVYEGKGSQGTFSAVMN